MFYFNIDFTVVFQMKSECLKLQALNFKIYTRDNLESDDVYFCPDQCMISDISQKLLLQTHISCC